MKNGPVISNISLINKAFSELGSPLHYKLIVDYLRINYGLGQGTTEENAISFLDPALKAGFYYEELEEQHYQRKQEIYSNLDHLYEELQIKKIPVKQNSKNPIYAIKELFSDPRFTIMETENGDKYILLTEWNLLNDLALRLFIREQLIRIPIFEAVQRVKHHYQIKDPNALFLPHFDPRFVVTSSGKVSLKSYDESQIQSYSIEATTFIREEVARHTPKLISFLQDSYGEEVKVRTLISNVFLIEAHTPKFSAYYEAVKELLQNIPSVRITATGDSFIYLDQEDGPTLVEKISLQGKTNTSILDQKVNKSGYNAGVLVEDIPIKTETTIGKTNKRTSITYTLRYYDRIQETISAFYFKDWIVNNEMQVDLMDDQGTATLFFLFDEVHNVLYGNHLENLMCDYALIPGQKLLFQMNTDDRVTLRISNVKDADIKEQDRYLDIAKLAEENRLTTKSLLQIVTETLIYHPSGLHVSEIVRLVKEEAPYAESSVTSTLSGHDFFEKVVGQRGYWIFNPARWRKSKYERLSLGSPQLKKANTKSKHVPQKVKSIKNQIKDLAKAARKNPRRLTNEMFITMDKKSFIDLAWNTYANNIYNIARRFSSHEIPMEDYFQEAYFALETAYEKYNPSLNGSFYNYFKRYLSNRCVRYQQNHHNLIRIPVHRLVDLRKIEKEIELDLLLKGNTYIEKEMESDYTILKTNYISFEELYAYEQSFAEIENDGIRAKIFSFFMKQSEIDNKFHSNTPLAKLNVEACEQTTFSGMMYQDKYNLLENSFLPALWEVVNENSRSSILPSQVLELRFGLNKENYDHTLEEVGKKLGVTRERIRQIEAKALERAMYWCQKKGYHVELFEFEK